MCLRDMSLFQKEMEVYNRPLNQRAEILRLSPRLFFLTLAGNFYFEHDRFYTSFRSMNLAVVAIFGCFVACIFGNNNTPQLLTFPPIHG